MTPSAILTLRPTVLAGLALGLAASLPVHTQVYRCNESGQTTYSDHPCGTRTKSVLLIDNTPSVADQKAARERTSAEAAEVQQMETARRKAWAAGDTREAQMAAQAAEQARRGQRQKVMVARENVRCCHRVYVGPLPYSQPYPTPMPVIRQPPALAAGALRQPGNGPKPFTQAPVAPTPIVPHPPRPYYPYYRIVCESGYACEGLEDLLLIQ